MTECQIILEHHASRSLFCMWKTVKHFSISRFSHEKICMLSTSFKCRTTQCDEMQTKAWVMWIPCNAVPTIHGLNGWRWQKVEPNKCCSYKSHRKYNLNGYWWNTVQTGVALSGDTFAKSLFPLLSLFSFSFSLSASCSRSKSLITSSVHALWRLNESIKSSRTRKWAKNKSIMQFDIAFKLWWWC